MKEFKKWLENHKHANWTWEEDAKEAWRTALEWVLKSKNLHLKSILIQEIKKELGDE